MARTAAAPKHKIGLPILCSLVLLMGCATVQDGQQRDARRLFRGRATSSQEGEPMPPFAGSVAVGGGGLVKDVQIPATGLSLGAALQSLRSNETMSLPGAALSKADEADLAVQLLRGNTTVYQPLFLAENTESRRTPLLDGDIVNVVSWDETPLIKVSSYQDQGEKHKVTDDLARSLEAMRGAIHNLTKTGLTDEESARIRNERDRATDPSEKRRLNELLSQTAGTIQKKTEQLRKAKTDLENEDSEENRQAVEQLTGELAHWEATLADNQRQLDAALARGQLRYTITGLFESPGTYTASPALDFAHIGPVDNASEISRGMAADVLVVNRRMGNLSEQYILPLAQNIAGVPIPNQLIEGFQRLREEAHVRDNDVIQYNQLRLLPLVLAGRMRQQLQQEIAAAPRRLDTLRNSQGLRRGTEDLEREPSSFSTNLRRLRQRLPSVSLPRLRVPGVF